jgi:hypothetical protein
VRPKSIRDSAIVFIGIGLRLFGGEIQGEEMHGRIEQEREGRIRQNTNNKTKQDMGSI